MELYKYGDIMVDKYKTITEIVDEQIEAVLNMRIHPANKIFVVTSCYNCPHSKVVCMMIGYNVAYCEHPNTTQRYVTVEAAANTVPKCCPLDDDMR